MLLQGVRLEAVGRPVKVVVPNAADKTFSLQQVNSCPAIRLRVKYF